MFYFTCDRSFIDRTFGRCKLFSRCRSLLQYNSGGGGSRSGFPLLREWSIPHAPTAAAGGCALLSALNSVKLAPTKSTTDDGQFSRAFVGGRRLIRPGQAEGIRARGSAPRRPGCMEARTPADGIEDTPPYRSIGGTTDSRAGPVACR